MKIINFLIYVFINFPKIYKNAFIKERITVEIDAKLGNKLNHNCEVDIDESILRKLFFLLILICSQNIDSG